jgi:hypothetical protein
MSWKVYMYEPAGEDEQVVVDDPGRHVQRRCAGGGVDQLGGRGTPFVAAGNGKGEGEVVGAEGRPRAGRVGCADGDRRLVADLVRRRVVRRQVEVQRVERGEVLGDRAGFPLHGESAAA